MLANHNTVVHKKNKTVQLKLDNNPLVCKEVVDAFGMFMQNAAINPATGTCTSLYSDGGENRKKRSNTDATGDDAEGGEG